MRTATFICFVILQNILFVASSYAQKSELRKANILFESGNYNMAITAFNNYGKTNKKPRLLVKRGISFLLTNQPDSCIRDMKMAEKLKSEDNNLYKYIAQAYMYKDDYIQAAQYYKIFLNTLPRGTDEWQHTVNQIKKCGFARNGKYYPQIAFVENIGNKVNTKNDEFYPKQSPNTLSRYYFSSARQGSIGGKINKNGDPDPVKGRYTADIYYTELTDGNWSTVQPLGENINSANNEWLQGFNTDGKIMYYIREPVDGNAYLNTDTFSLKNNLLSDTKPVRTLPFNPENGDQYLHYFNDSLILFSAKKDGGMGGYDLYYAMSQNGNWSLPVNMGPEINSPFDEIHPYVTKDGNTLYFSSDRNESFGGFDVFSSTFTNGRWSDPQNAGNPINSSGNDIHFQISTDGTMALFASDRITSLGGFDIYVCYFKDQLTNQFDIVDIPQFTKKIQDPSSSTEYSPESTKPIVSKKQLIIRSISFTDDAEILNTSHISYLKRLAESIVIYPKTKIIVQSHTNATGKPDMELFLSLKRAESVADQLAKSGIKKENIVIQGLGANYPMLQLFNGSEYNRAAEKTNKHIDIRVIPEDEALLDIQYEWPVVPDNQIDSRWKVFQAAYTDTLLFRVKIAETSQMLKNEVIVSDNNVFIEQYPLSNQYLYTTGNFATWHEAFLYKSKLISHNIFGADIIPYLNGIRMTNEDIYLYQDKYPELALYLKNKQ